MREGLSFFLPFLKFYYLHNFQVMLYFGFESKVIYAKCVKETVSYIDTCNLKTPTIN